MVLIRVAAQPNQSHDWLGHPLHFEVREGLNSKNPTIGIVGSGGRGW